MVLDWSALVKPLRQSGCAGWILIAILVCVTVWLAVSAEYGSPEEDTVDPLDVVPRADWGAVEPELDSQEGLYDAVANPGGWLVYDEPLPEVLTTIIVHHSALPVGDGPREIQQKHLETRGLADIAYHFVIDADGRACQGRDLTVRGAHTAGRNTGTVGVVLLGNLQIAQPTGEQMATLRSLCAWLVDEYAITHLAGHRDFAPGETVCPGDNLEILLPGLATDLGIEFGTGGYAGP
jgi:hypothetical protein